MKLVSFINENMHIGALKDNYIIPFQVTDIPKDMLTFTKW